MKLHHILLSLLSLTTIGTTAAKKCKKSWSSYCDDSTSKPYLCGKGLKCEYNNVCLAKDAGYDITYDCKPEKFCRKPDFLECPRKDQDYEGSFTLSLSPYPKTQLDCAKIKDWIWSGPRGCKYCVLYNAKSYCVKTCAKLCVDGGTVSSVSIKPYTCGKHLKCEYENKCLAKAAGYDIIHDCKPKNICRKPKNKKCKNRGKSKELICGDLKCEYKSKCLAKAAGYAITHDCKPKNICREPKDKCENIGSSYICGDLKCEYKNKCLAEAAGYDLNDDCKTVDTDEKSKDIGYIKNGTFKSKKTFSQPFFAKLSSFGPKSARSYDSCINFENDLNSAATIIVNDVIQRNSQYNDYYTNYDDYLVMEMAPADPGPASEMDGSSPDSSENENGQESSYGTNNQIDGVDEADIVKATADIVFAGYGNKLVVFNVKTGKKMSETVMGFKSSSENEISTVKVKGLLLHKDRLVVIITIRRNMGWGWGRGYYGEKSSKKVISSYGTDTFVYLYDVSESELPKDGSEMKLLASHTIEGHDFNTARSIGNTTHLVTMSSVNVYNFLEDPLSRWQKKFSEYNDDEYLNEAKLYATLTVIPSFVKQMLKEMDSKHNCNDIVRLSLFKSVDENISEDEKISVHAIKNSLMQGLAQITTFNMDADYTSGTSENDESIPLLNVSDTRVFLPQTYGTNVYASTNVLLIAAKGHKFWKSDSIWKDNTYIIGFSLNDDGSRVQGRGVGTVPGYLLNQWALDVWDDHIRVASTTEGKWGCSNEMISDFRSVCTWTLLTDTDNQISVLKLPTDDEVLDGKTTMEMVGFLGGLGEVGERITSVRFMKDKAFLVTFLRTDPFYAIDMSNHSMPVEKSALKITGFSNYIHPYDKDGNILITVGQDATDDGRVLGLQVSIFNATDLSNLSLLFRHNVENETNVWSSSDALFDHKAFRFLHESKKLIIQLLSEAMKKDMILMGFSFLM